MVNFIFYKTAALFVAISAMLHLVSPVAAGRLSPDASVLIPLGILYLLFAWGLRGKKRWVAYPAFIILLIGTLLTYGYSYNGTTVPAWTYGSITLANAIALVALFICLWRSKPFRA